MVSPLTWVLVGIVVYTVVAMALRARGKLPDYVRVSGPIMTLHTGRGRAFLDRLARPKRIWRAWGNLGVGVALVVMVGMFVAVFNAGYQSLNQPERTPVQDPQNVLVIPGVNDFLPVAAAPEIVFGLLVGLVVHEGGHGLLCRVEDIDIDSMGLAFFSFIPIGAFVEPDEDNRREASRGSQTRMFAAGVTNNFLVAFLGFVLLFGPVAGSIAVAPGMAVGDATDGSAAAEAGLGYGDVVTSVDGQSVANESEFSAALDDATGEQVTIGLRDGESVTVNRSVLMTRAVPSVIEGVTLSRGNATIIERVNGTDIATKREFARAMDEREVAEIETNRGTATFPVGVYVVQVLGGEPFARAGAPTDADDLIITHVDGERTANTTAFQDVMDDTEPGQDVTITAYVDGDRETYNVTLGSSSDVDGGYLGVRPEFGYSGLVVDDVGVDAYPAEEFLGYLGGDNGFLGGLIGGDFLVRIYVATLLPFFSVVAPSVAYNFAGFVGPVTGFYTVTGPLSVLGGGIFVAANLLFWVAWVNLNLGVFNLVPTFPLDGGHILRASAESFVARLPITDGRRVTSAVTASISLLMIAGLVLMLFGPQLT